VITSKIRLCARSVYGISVFGESCTTINRLQRRFVTFTLIIKTPTTNSPTINENTNSSIIQNDVSTTAEDLSC